ncbi:MAG: hypothetical protein R3F62_05200 [Planctomycetota bacterium]
MAPLALSLFMVAWCGYMLYRGASGDSVWAHGYEHGWPRQVDAETHPTQFKLTMTLYAVIALVGAGLGVLAALGKVQ